MCSYVRVPIILYCFLERTIYTQSDYLYKLFLSKNFNDRYVCLRPIYSESTTFRSRKVGLERTTLQLCERKSTTTGP